MFGHKNSKKSSSSAKRARPKKEAKKTASSMQVQEDTSILDQTETVESAVNNSFFYTSDKFFVQMDNSEIMKTLVAAYPEFSAENSDTTIKKSLIKMLDDDIFITQTLSYYGITLHEFFMMLYKQYASIFRGPYLKKVKQLLSTKRYAQATRHTV